MYNQIEVIFLTCAERIENLRKKKNLSRRQLAIQAHISPTSLQSAITRNGDISMDMLIPIANVLNANVFYLRDGGFNTVFDREFSDLINKFDEEGQNAIKLFVDTYELLNVDGRNKVFEYLADLAGNDKYRWIPKEGSTNEEKEIDHHE